MDIDCASAHGAGALVLVLSTMCLLPSVTQDGPSCLVPETFRRTCRVELNGVHIGEELPLPPPPLTYMFMHKSIQHYTYYYAMQCQYVWPVPL